jgi:hypothetical protein
MQTSSMTDKGEQVPKSKPGPDEGGQAIYGVGTFIVLMTFMMGSIVVAILTVKHLPL